MTILPACMHVGHMHQKRTSEPLALELQTLVSHHVGAGIEPESSAIAANALPSFHNRSPTPSTVFILGVLFLCMSSEFLLCAPYFPYNLIWEYSLRLELKPNSS